MNDANHQLRVYETVLGLLPSEDNPTPLIRMHRVIPYKRTMVYAKLDWYTPFGANKDRVAANMIRDAEERGLLQPNKKLVEATSGNTGVGLALIGNAKGYPLQTPLSAKIPVEKRTVLRFLGANVVELDDSLCPAPGAPEGAIAKAMETAETQEDFVLLNQYANEANPDAHYRTTGPEIWRQTEGKITHFVAGLGTCGTITGTGRFLKEKNHNVKVIGVHPEEGHDIPGVRSIIQLQQTKFFKPDEYDQITEVTNRESFDMCLRINREESIIAGPSSGMALVGALRVIPDEPGNVVVIVFPDNVFKYASSMVRHFPHLAPQDDKQKNNAPSENDQLMARMMENLKNPHDTIKADDLSQRLTNGQAQKPLLIDIRTPDMYANAHINGSLNIPLEELPDRTGELPSERDADIVMVCGIGKFSKQTTLYLKSMGYCNVRSLKGGVNEWLRKGHALNSSNK